MKAARWHGHDRQLAIEDVPDPLLRPGALVVRVLSCFVSPTMASILSSAKAPPMPPAPFVPGMNIVGEVLEIADDVRGLSVGDKVFCDPLIRSANPSGPDDGCFIGYFGFSEAARALLARWPDGGFAGKALFPAECVTPLGAASGTDAAVLARLGHLGTAWGAFARAGFVPGCTVSVTGATGILGVSTVLLALAMGAGRIVALGRRPEILSRLEAAGRGRVEAADYDSVPPGADILVDALGKVPGPGPTLAAIGGLKRGGRAVLIGGVAGELPLSYGGMLGSEIAVIGSLWFERDAIGTLLRMIGTGQLDLSGIEAERFPLEKANEAMAAAAGPHDGFRHVAVVPA